MPQIEPPKPMTNEMMIRVILTRVNALDREALVALAQADMRKRLEALDTEALKALFKLAVGRFTKHQK